MHINLLPPEFVTKQVLRRRFWSWIFVIAFAMIAGTTWSAARTAQVAGMAQQLASETQAHPHLRRLVVELRQAEQQLNDLKIESAAVRSLRSDKRVLSLVGLCVTTARAAGGHIELRTLAIRLPPSGTTAKIQDVAARPDSGRAADSPPSGLLAIDGLADDATTLAHLVSALRDAGIFSQVNLKGSTESAIAGQKSRQFQIECQYE